MDSDVAASQSPRRIRLPSTFAALRHRNFRLWFLGQTVSLMGTWMQMVAQGWLVYELTGSKLALGTISFIGSLPTLFLMVPAGALADRGSRRGMMMAAQVVMTLQAFALAFLAATGRLTVFGLAVMFAALAGWVCIAAFLALLRRVGLLPFVIYRLVLGLVLIYIIL